MNLSGQAEHRGFPVSGGRYLLLITLDETTKLTIGRLGEFHFDHGNYAYIGSAFGLGGLSARIKRHLRQPGEKRQHWHIDHLLTVAGIRDVGWSTEVRFSECDWSRSLAEQGRHWPPRFGASDCGCEGHLVQFEGQIRTETIAHAITDRIHFNQHKITA